MAQIHEKLVEEWFRRKGYFTIRGAKAKGSGNNEIDILALRSNEDGTQYYRHIKCQISFRPIGYISTNPRTRLKRTALKRSKIEIDEDAPVWVKQKYFSPKVENIRNSFVNHKVNWMYTFVHHKVKDEYELEVIKNQGIELISFQLIMDQLDPKADRTSDARDEVELLKK